MKPSKPKNSQHILSKIVGTKFAWLYNENEKPSITNKEGFIFRSAREYFGSNPSSRQVKATYNAWTKNFGGARSYAENLRQKSPNIHKVCVVIFVIKLY